MKNQDTATADGILLVDDDPIFLALATASLKKAGYRTVTASDGMEAMQLLDREGFALAVIDLSMPHIDGLRLIAIMRASTRHRHTKILVVSGTPDSQDCVEAMTSGATATLGKPVSWGSFPQLIRSLLHAEPIAEPAGTAVDGNGRNAPRSRVLKRGVVAFNGRHSTLECTIRDISETGCLISSDAHRMIPDTFELLIELDGLWFPSEVVWRRSPRIGIRFVGAPEQAKLRRTQIVAQTTSLGPRLRRRSAG